MAQPSRLVGWLALAGAMFAVPAQAGWLPVSGKADPWLAGLSAPATASGGDTVAIDAPVLVGGITLTPGDSLTFRAFGSVGYGPDTPLVNKTSGPDGLLVNGHATTHYAGAENGISDYRVPANALVGVFLDNGLPTSGPAPSALDFSPTGNVPLGTGYHQLAPALKQVFFIGDGLDASLQSQRIVVPDGATRLYLGVADGTEWSNNHGSFDVAINPTPEPGALTLWALGMMGWSGWALRRTRFVRS